MRKLICKLPKCFANCELQTANSNPVYVNECTENIHQIPTYIQKMYKQYKTYTKFRLKTT